MLRRSSSSGVHRGGFSRDPTLSDHDVDDIAFLTGQENGFLMNKRALYEPGSVLVCSQRHACLVVSLCFMAIIVSAIIVAFTKPGCPPATYIGEPVEDDGAHVLRDLRRKELLATNGEQFPWNNVRLPSTVKPLMYSVHLHPNFTAGITTGQVTIKLTAKEETDFIILHSRGLNITSYRVHNKYLEPNNVVRFLEYLKNEQIYLGLSDTLYRGSNYTLFMEFKMALKEGLDGLYLSSYKKDGVKRYLAATHFEPTSARAAFPCFDEPIFKARFNLSIVREPDYFTLFNMPLKQSVPVQGTNLIRDEFETTVEMSSYLVCFVLCDFSYVTSTTSNNITVRVYAPAHIIDQADYALHSAITLLEYYQQFFTVPYPLPKLDLIAIPDFGAGAMENWGLVTYRESAIMFIEGRSSSRAKQRITVVIAHELAHQWFGNLVTMEWWQDLWLNEGFASFMEVLGTSKVEPEWSMMDQFVVDMVQPALALDSLVSSHPVSTIVDDPAHIEAIFDTISYKKGASLIYMLEMFLGRPTVVAGLRAYLDHHRYSSATSYNLWESFGDASETRAPLDVIEIMDTWTRQVGYPVITVKVVDGHVYAEQKRFVLSRLSGSEMPEPSTTTVIPEILQRFLPDDGPLTDLTADLIAPLNTTIGFKWHVPLTYITSADPHHQELVWMNLTNVEFEIPNDLLWVKFNAGQRGFYRVNYDPITWQALINQLYTEHERLPSADRASLIDDAFALASASEINVSVALELSMYLKSEQNFGPWHTAFTHLFDWARLLFSKPHHKHLLSHICTILEPQYHAIGWEDTGTHLRKLLRAEILQAAVDCGYEDAIEAAKERFEMWKADNATVPANLRSIVYQAGIRYSGDEAWWWCWKQYLNSSLASERRLLLEALAQTSSAWLLNQFLQYSMNSTLVRGQDVHFTISEISRNPNGRLLAWRSVRRYWSEIMELYGHSSFAISEIITAVTVHHTTLFDLREVEEFFEKVPVGGGERALQASLETIRQNVAWLAENTDDISAWLQEHYPRE